MNCRKIPMPWLFRKSSWIDKKIYIYKIHIMNKNHNVIGEGTYGCLHNISLRCDKDKVNNDYDISKITFKEYGEDELKKNATMDIIDKEYRFHLGKSKKCTIKNNKINKDAIGKCLQSTKIDKENITNNVLILMKDGGIDLEKFAIKIQDYKSTRTNVNMMKKFWIEVERLLLGIQLFQKKILFIMMSNHKIFFLMKLIYV